MTTEEFADIAAIRRLVTWLAAREVRREADPQAALDRLRTELAELPTEWTSAKMDKEDAKGRIELAISDLVGEVGHQSKAH